MLLEKTKAGTATVVSILWDSVGDPAATVATMTDEAQRQRATDYATGASADERGNIQKWLGAPTSAVLRERLSKGWQEGVERLLKLAVRDIEVTSIRRRRVKADQGDELDIQAVYSGNLDRAWSRTRRQTRSGGMRQVNIVCNLAASWSVDAETLFWRGASALRLASALSESGYTVGIYAADATVNAADNVHVCQSVEIKAPDQPLDLSALAAITCMPGFFRTSLFAGIVYACQGEGKVAGSGLGQPEHQRLGKWLSLVGINDAIVQPEVKDQKSAEAWIDAALATIGA